MLPFNFLKNQVGIIPTKIMKCNWQFTPLLVNLIFQVTMLMCSSTKFSSEMALIPHDWFYQSVQFLFTYVTMCCRFKFLFSFLIPYHINIFFNEWHDVLIEIYL